MCIQLLPFILLLYPSHSACLPFILLWLNLQRKRQINLPLLTFISLPLSFLFSSSTECTLTLCFSFSCCSFSLHYFVTCATLLGGSCAIASTANCFLRATRAFSHVLWHPGETLTDVLCDRMHINTHTCTQPSVNAARRKRNAALLRLL